MNITDLVNKELEKSEDKFGKEDKLLYLKNKPRLRYFKILVYGAGERT